MDRFLGRTNEQGQQTDIAIDPAQRKDNLFEPPPGDPAAHGIFDEGAHARSPQWWLNTHRPLVAAGTAAVAIGRGRGGPPMSAIDDYGCSRTAARGARRIDRLVLPDALRHRRDVRPPARPRCRHCTLEIERARRGTHNVSTQVADGDGSQALPEQVGVATGVPLGNFPLVLIRLSQIHAAPALEAAG